MRIHRLLAIAAALAVTAAKCDEPELPALAPVTAAELAAEPSPAEAPAETPAASAIELQPNVSVAGDRVTLGDVAPLPPEHPLAEIDLAAAPLPGSTRTLTRGQIELRLARAGFDPRTLTITGPGSVSVSRASRQIAPAELAAMLNQLLPVAVTIERLPPRRELPPGELSCSLRGGLPAELPERFNVPLDILVDGIVADRLTLGVRRADLTTPIAPVASPVAIRDSGSLPTPAPAPMGLTAPEPPAPTFEVKRGDTLTVLAIAGRVQVSLMAEAREKGGYGDLIQCQVTINGTRRLIAAKLIAPDRAVMEL